MADDQTAIRKVVDDWLEASARGDVQAMLPFLADDMVFLVAGAPPFGKKEFLAAWEGPMKGARCVGEADMEEILIIGEYAHTRTKLKVTITTADGNTSSAAGYTMTLFHKQGGRWVMKRDANLLTPVK